MKEIKRQKKKSRCNKEFIKDAEYLNCENRDTINLASPNTFRISCVSCEPLLV